MKITKELKKLSDKYPESNFLKRKKRKAQKVPCGVILCKARNMRCTGSAFVSGKKGDA